MSIELELPGWYIDDLEFDDLGSGAGDPYFELIGQKPEPNQVDFKIDGSIEFFLVTHAADSPVTAGLEIRITVGAATEVVAYTAGTFQAGWNGAGSTAVLVDPRSLKIVVDPTTDFPSQTTVSVRVIATTSSLQTLDETYSFETEDRSFPILLSASSREKKVVRIVFNEPVNQESSDGSGSALNPLNYAFERTTRVEDPSLLFPSVPLSAVSVEIVDSSTVDVTLDWEMTQGFTYLVVASNVEDVFGNVIAAPNNQAVFFGFVPEVVQGRNFDVWMMIPRKNRDEDNGIGDLRRLIEVFKEVCSLMLCSVDRFTDIIDPDIAEEKYIDAILCDLGNPFSFVLDLNQKRKLIRILVSIYKQKGTEPGIINAIRFFLGIEVTITTFAGEGWELGIDELGGFLDEGTAILGPGTSFQLYSFDITSPVDLTDEQRGQIRDIVNLMKTAHEHFINLVEPTGPEAIDHIELGLSILGDDQWDLHE